jgi:hypothetical protein
MFTAEQARIMFENVVKEDPTRWPAAVQTLIVDALNTLEKVVRATSTLALEVKSLKGEAPTVAGDEAPAEAAPEAEAAPAGIDPEEAERRANMSPEQRDLEAQMDAAVSAEAQSAAPKRARKQKGAPVPPAEDVVPPAPVRTVR